MGTVGDVGNGALSSDMGADAIRVVGFVSDHNRARLEPIEQGLGVGDVMGLAGEISRLTGRPLASTRVRSR